MYRKEPIGLPRQSQTILQFLSYFQIDCFTFPSYSVVLPFHAIFPTIYFLKAYPVDHWDKTFMTCPCSWLLILLHNSVTGLPAKTQLDSKVLVNFRSHVQTLLESSPCKTTHQLSYNNTKCEKDIHCLFEPLLYKNNKSHP